MANLASVQKTSAVLKKYGIKISKKYGQNFLVDAHVIDEILEAADLTKEDFVLEIGPGIGTLTQALAEEAKEVTAVEIDRSLQPVLLETLSGYENVSVIFDDILKVDLLTLNNEKNGGKPLHVVANLPYYITTPILLALFESGVPLDSVVVMVQEEVAKRMQAGPGTKDYGSLSLLMQYYAKPEITARVPSNCFLPRPKVDSAVVRLSVFEEPPVRVKDEDFLFRLIRASFEERRKMLPNSLSADETLGCTKEDVRAALSRLNLPPDIRGEALTLSQFAALSDLLGKKDGDLRRKA